MIFQTENSKYEIDITTKSIRRLSGTKECTLRQHSGAWRSYKDVMIVNNRLLIEWADEPLLPGSPEGAACTILSPFKGLLPVLS